MYKKLGLIGGIGYLSTLEYYKKINECFQNAISPTSPTLESPEIFIDCLNLAKAYSFLENTNFENFTSLFIEAVKRCYVSGADFVAIAANTAHIVYDEICSVSPIPVIGIVDETCAYAQKKGYQNLVILGTKFTMKSGMYNKKCEQYGMNCVLPNEDEIEIINNIIFPNLESGLLLSKDKKKIIDITNNLIMKCSSDALVLGCTELSLAISQDDINVPLIDTAKIHIESIVKEILQIKD